MKPLDITIVTSTTLICFDSVSYTSVRREVLPYLSFNIWYQSIVYPDIGQMCIYFGNVDFILAMISSALSVLNLDTSYLNHQFNISSLLDRCR